MRSLNMQALAAPLAAAALLAGCGSLVPRTEAPVPPLRSDFRAGAPAPAVDTAAADAAAREWAGFINDPRLREVVGIALTQNRSLRASAAAVERVQAQYRIQRAAGAPQLGVSAAATRQRTLENGAATSYSLSLGLAAWEIDLFDRLGSLEGAALARYLAQTETQQSARLSLVAETLNAWLNLQALQQRAVLAQQLLQSQQRTLDLAEAQYQRGASSGLDRARARTAFEAARGEAARSAVAVQQARAQLELLAGQPLPDALLPDALLPAAQETPGRGDATALPAIPAGLPAEVLLQRPDVRAAEQALQASAFDVGAARAALFPRLTLTASAGTRSAELGGLFGRGSGVWSVVPQLDLALFDAGARRAQVDASEASRREALARYEATLQTAFREVADALAVRDGLAERLSAQQAQVDAAQRSLGLVEQGYRLGANSQLDLLDAQRQLASAQQGLVDLRQAERANRVDLLRALGGRW
ncbi:efflux transporter outer membrane subunit [Hydrogenophaga crocea]|uniref:Efflux transporter outer membrane subunit n=1 Tax=Hydrogenophaga crocea TaxID=2716225 RepID=A0A6G8IM91_9BURK|nr:efflux transporter outer membrane subunit [Hydrogenophaga crocea]QIM54229.1 efflux transporter outer membrane subunit [Hydrogenophaga crocea]